MQDFTNDDGISTLSLIHRLPEGTPLQDVMRDPYNLVNITLRLVDVNETRTAYINFLSVRIISLTTSTITALISGYDVFMIDESGWTTGTQVSVKDPEFVARIIDFPTENLFNLEYLTDDFDYHELRAWDVFSDGTDRAVDCVQCQTSGGVGALQTRYSSCPGPFASGDSFNIPDNVCRITQLKT